MTDKELLEEYAQNQGVLDTEAGLPASESPAPRANVLGRAYQSYVADPLTRGGTAALGTIMPKGVARFISQAVVPQDLTELGAMAGGMMLGGPVGAAIGKGAKFLPAAMRQLPKGIRYMPSMQNAIKQALGTGAGAYGGATIEGKERPGTEAFLQSVASLASSAGEAVGRRVWRGGAHLGNARHDLEVFTDAAKDLSDFNMLSPSLRRRFDTPEDLIGMLRYKKGMDTVLQKDFDKAITTIEKNLLFDAQRQFQVPEAIVRAFPGAFRDATVGTSGRSWRAPFRTVMEMFSALSEASSKDNKLVETTGQQLFGKHLRYIRGDVDTLRGLRKKAERELEATIFAGTAPRYDASGNIVSDGETMLRIWKEAKQQYRTTKTIAKFIQDNPDIFKGNGLAREKAQAAWHKMAASGVEIEPETHEAMNVLLGGPVARDQFYRIHLGLSGKIAKGRPDELPYVRPGSIGNVVSQGIGRNVAAEAAPRLYSMDE